MIKCLILIGLNLSVMICAKATLESKVVINEINNENEVQFRKLDSANNENEVQFRKLDSAKCRAECFRKNGECCDRLPKECGSTCFEEARSCYNACRNSFSEDFKSLCDEERIVNYNSCIVNGEFIQNCVNKVDQSYNECLSRKSE